MQSLSPRRLSQFCSFISICITFESATRSFSLGRWRISRGFLVGGCHFVGTHYGLKVSSDAAG